MIKMRRLFSKLISWRRLMSILLLLWWVGFICFGVVAFIESEAKKIDILNQLRFKERVLLNKQKAESESVAAVAPGEVVSGYDDVDLNKPSQTLESEIPFSKFSYPINVDMPALVDKYKKNGSADVSPINPFTYSYIHKATDVCKSQRTQTDKNVFILFLIKSATKNTRNRDAIRHTWAKQDNDKNTIIKHVFLLGKTNNNTINEFINKESEQYHDIVQMSFMDTYYSNTLKTMGGIHWSVKNCKKARFVLVVDDDFYVGTYALIHYLSDLQNSDTSNLYMGNVFDFPRPYRSPKSKWHMSLSEYPYDKYPSFVSAGAILMSMEFVEKVNIAMQFTKKFIYDDIFIAIVVYKLGVIPIGNRRFHMIKVHYSDIYFDEVLVSHGYGDPRELRLAWKCATKGICKKIKPKISIGNLSKGTYFTLIVSLLVLFYTM